MQIFKLELNIDAGIGFLASIEPDWDKSIFNINLDLYAEAKVPMKIEGGLYIPPTPGSPLVTAFVVGLDGVIAHGKAGVKLVFCINTLEFDFDLYFIFHALKFQFFVQAKIEIKTPIFSFEDKYDVIRIELFGIEIENHSSQKAQAEAFKKNRPYQVNSPIGIGFIPIDD